MRRRRRPKKKKKMEEERIVIKMIIRSWMYIYTLANRLTNI